MSADDDSEMQRALLRDLRSSNTSPRENLPPSAPSLPPLRSLSTRRSDNVDASTRTRSAFDFSNRYYELVIPWTDDHEDVFDDTDHWENDMPLDPEPRLLEREYDRRTTNSLWQPTMDEENSQSRTQRFIQAYQLRRALLDQTHGSSPTLPELFSSRTSQPHDPPEDNRRVKRRKLDSDRLSSNFRGFQYGKYGQVQPGQLTMELVSCDGGMYSSDDTSTKYAAENILKNDHSVYCTEGPRCNIVLRHQGATVFTLKELVIKAPRSNFTDPSAGIVFVSMTSDHLFNRTAQYQIQYSPARRRNERETQPLNPILSIRHNEDGTTMTRAQVRARRLFNIGLDDEDNEVAVAQIPSEFNIPPPSFQVTAECSDDDEVDDIGIRISRRPPNRIGSLPFENISSDDEGSDDISISAVDYRSRRRRNRTNSTLAEAAEAVQVATQEAVRAVGGELMSPNASFYIESHQSKCTIPFDPPISGRFILLKMWNPRRGVDTNIDIQAIVARGFAGPRFFPSVELR
ncbi:hypothetical protein RRF57_003649 [Xylaria bambusicola]|uniref:Uncharacterized protein n=1 Tax=Xylaria bambusicola TaxID=326684 RepID=A0AAN7UUS7_9PEZI